MGISGHIGIAFQPQDEALAIAAFSGLDDAPEGDDWVKYQTDFGLTGEDWWAMNRTLEQLATSNPSLAPLAGLLVGQRSIGEGPGTDYFLFTAAEVRTLADACSQVTNSALEQAVVKALAHADFAEWLSAHPEVVGPFGKDLVRLFGQIASELDRVSTGGWSMISAMV